MQEMLNPGHSHAIKLTSDQIARVSYSQRIASSRFLSRVLGMDVDSGIEFNIKRREDQ
jgi:hypothetical protein